MVRPRMTFGYIGYLWTLMGCGGFALLFGVSAAILYGVSRRNHEARKEPQVSVTSVPLAPRAPRDPRPGA